MTTQQAVIQQVVNVIFLVGLVHCAIHVRNFARWVIAPLKRRDQTK